MDKIEIFNNRLKELNEHLDAIKKFGFDEDILITYLVVKLKVSRKKAEQIVQCYDDFYNKTIKKAIIDNLE
jgi:hypothetical protein